MLHNPAFLCYSNRMTASYRVHGTTDDTDTCEMCGKTELRSVVMLAVLDNDGPTGELIYAGSTCAARMLAKRGTRITATRIRGASVAAARVAEQAREFAAEFAPFTLNQYIAANSRAYLNAAGGSVAGALAAARDGYVALRREIAAIEGGTLVGTRFESLLPKI